MLSLAPQENGYGGSNTDFLSPNPSRKGSSPKISSRRSTSSLRGSPSPDLEAEAVNGRHSLAHELAVALMPEPSAGSKLLAEEFGIEYDEGAEGIDEDPTHEGIQIVIGDAQSSFADELQSQDASLSQSQSPYFGSVDMGSEDTHSEWEQTMMIGSPVVEETKSSKKTPEVDDLATLARDLESTDKFLSHLRKLDTETHSSSHQMPALEQMASDIIRKINNSSRDREGQLRELLGYEREFKQISSEVGGNDVLGSLDEWPQEEDLGLDSSRAEVLPPQSRTLDTLEEEPTAELSMSNDWETDPDAHTLGDELDVPTHATTLTSPTKDTFPPPPSITGPLTPAKTLPQLADLRSFTSSLISSLSTISENAQVNGAATSEAGRKIRALKNKMGGWRTDWDSAERSMQRIEKWEAGISQSDIPNGIITASKLPTGRIDGRKIVEEHMRLFEKALADAAVKTQAIRAAC